MDMVNNELFDLPLMKNIMGVGVMGAERGLELKLLQWEHVTRVYSSDGRTLKYEITSPHVKVLTPLEKKFYTVRKKN